MNIFLSGRLQYIFAQSPSADETINTAIESLGNGEKKLWYRICFDGNGADSGVMNDMISLVSGEEYRLNPNQYAKSGESFKEWNTKPDGSGESYADGAAIFRQASKNGERFTLYAQWETHTHGKTEFRGAKEATCQQEGYTGDEYCLECGSKVTDGKSIDKLPHTLIVDEAAEATCTADGKTEGSHCSMCNDVIILQNTIPAKGHDWIEDYTVDRPSTETEEGQESIHCKRCEEIKDARSLSVIEEGHEHEQMLEQAIEATCTTAGRTERVRCRTCGNIFLEFRVIQAKGHDWDTEPTTDIQPTSEKEGQESIHCKNCEMKKDVRMIPKLDEGEEQVRTDLRDCSLTLEKDSYVYDGKEKRPAVTVEYGNMVLNSSDYDVVYSGNVHPGTAIVTVTGKGDYTGTIEGEFKIRKAANSIAVTAKYTKISKTKAQTFKLNVRAKGGALSCKSNSKNVKVDKNGKVTIAKNFVGKAVITITAGNGDYVTVSKKVTLTVNPSKPVLSSVKNTSGRKLSVKWKKSSQGTAYQIQYAVKSNFSGAKSKFVSGASRTSKTLTGLKKNKTYYVRIRTYKTVSKVKYYSSWSTVKKTKIKK